MRVICACRRMLKTCVWMPVVVAQACERSCDRFVQQCSIHNCLAMSQFANKWPIRIFAALPCDELAWIPHGNAVGSVVAIANNFAQQVTRAVHFPVAVGQAPACLP